MLRRKDRKAVQADNQQPVHAPTARTRLYPPLLGPVVALVLVAATLFSLAIAVGVVARLMALEQGSSAFVGPLAAIALALGLVGLLVPALGRLVVGRHADHAARRLADLAADQGMTTVALPLPQDAMARVSRVLDALEAQGRGLPIVGIENGETEGELRLRVARSALPAFHRLADLLTEALEREPVSDDANANGQPLEHLAQRVEAGVDDIARMLVEQEAQLRDALAVVLAALSHDRTDDDAVSEPSTDPPAATAILIPAIADTLALVDERQETLIARFDAIVAARTQHEEDLRDRLDRLLAARSESSAGLTAIERGRDSGAPSPAAPGMMDTEALLSAAVVDLVQQSQALVDLVARLENVADATEGATLDAPMAAVRQRLEAADTLLDRYDVRLSELADRFRQLGSILASRTREAMEEADAALESLSDIGPQASNRLDAVFSRLERAADSLERNTLGFTDLNTGKSTAASAPPSGSLRESIARLQPTLSEPRKRLAADPSAAGLADLSERIGRIEAALQALVDQGNGTVDDRVTSLEDRLQDRRR